ncbi:MAG: arginine repressor [Epulopiscium sp. Nuni2H_MBin003]|nr:MAG: arginine repressor [Epulopiscium sp. Nuni2H_MBin003]
MGRKEQRQTAILSIIDKYNIETQEELVENLEKAGYSVTQATISRDIRELKLTKVAISIDKQKYVTLNSRDHQISTKVIKVFKAGFLSADEAQNIVVVKTLPGMGNAVAAAIDAFNYAEIVGTIAGDDTIFCAIKDGQVVQKVIEQFYDILS